MNFYQKLDSLTEKNNSLVCVGLDSDIENLPEKFKHLENGQSEFNKQIISATHDLVCCYKPNSAFYESRGAKGINDLKLTCDYIRGIYPDIPIILDAKRADVGNTNKGYIKFAFDYLGVDAITLNPYLGKEALLPFINLEDKGVIILCKTSNEGSNEFQNLTFEGKKLYQIIAEKISHEWNTHGNVSIVAGATYPEELRDIRKIVGDMLILVPGVGTQGGDVEKTIKAGLNSKNRGLIINSSRGIIFASQNDDFAEKARVATENLKNQINSYR